MERSREGRNLLIWQSFHIHLCKCKKCYTSNLRSKCLWNYYIIIKIAVLFIKQGNKMYINQKETWSNPQYQLLRCWSIADPELWPSHEGEGSEINLLHMEHQVSQTGKQTQADRQSPARKTNNHTNRSIDVTTTKTRGGEGLYLYLKQTGRCSPNSILPLSLFPAGLFGL